jgi:serine/threonine protein kinase
MQPVPRVPGYELLQPLGGGLVTAVFSARNCADDTPCAVKVLRREWQAKPTAIKLMQREARAGLVVRHPHIVRLLDAHVLFAPYFLVMEMLAGESLRMHLRRHYRVDVRTALWIARQIAEALAALHRQGFVHGDVKPDNIRLVDSGTAKLIDLGLAHRPGENAAFLKHGYVLGTANYLAPELCACDAADDEFGDLFSLGVTLFEMLTGRLPYPAGSTKQTLHRHQCDPPADVRQYVEHVPKGLVNLLQQLLVHQPTDRPSASVVVQHLVGLEIAVLRRRVSA